MELVLNLPEEEIKELSEMLTQLAAINESQSEKYQRWADEVVNSSSQKNELSDIEEYIISESELLILMSNAWIESDIEAKETIAAAENLDMNPKQYIAQEASKNRFGSLVLCDIALGADLSPKAVSKLNEIKQSIVLE